MLQRAVTRHVLLGVWISFAISYIKVFMTNVSRHCHLTEMHENYVTFIHYFISALTVTNLFLCSENKQQIKYKILSNTELERS